MKKSFISLEAIITCHQRNLLPHEEPWPKRMSSLIMSADWYLFRWHWTTLVFASHPPHCKTAFLRGIHSLSEADQSHKNSRPDCNSNLMPLFYFSMVVLYPRLCKFSHPDNVFLSMTNTLKSSIQLPQPMCVSTNACLLPVMTLQAQSAYWEWQIILQISIITYHPLCESAVW
jgi:hypothetical protein